jgi:DNA-binding winged helix-turn-helix (wHTH) protein/TolB-like protein/Flp pilus assembly protein TadD
MSDNPNHLHQIGKCRLDSEKKVLWFNDEPVALPLKAVELLSVLVERSGEVVTKDEIWRAVWQDSFVEETNLTHNIYLLRKTLKDLGEPDLIQTVPRRGYRFAGETRTHSNGDLVIEKHSFTRTLVEEVPVEVAQAGPTLPPPLRTYVPTVVAVGAIAAIVVLIAGIAAWKFRGDNTAIAGSAVRSIAVLPLVSVNGEPDDRSLSLGFADALITSLGELEGVRVVSTRGSKDLMAISAQDPAQLGKELSVDSVLDGTLQRANGKLRVTLRLIRSSDGVQIWSGSFDESEDEIFKLQDAMARQTASALSREASAGKHSTENRDAYHAYLRGRFFFDKRDSENYAKAIDEFNLAVKFDPAYALAYAGLADVYAMQANISAHDRKRRDELYERSRTMASKALSIDETCAEAHTSLAWIMRVHDWNWEGSEREFKRAIELDPNYANARQWYSFLLLGLGRMDESLVQMEKALELEPLSRIILNNSLTVRNYRGEVEMLSAIVERLDKMENAGTQRSWAWTLAYSRIGEYAKVIEVGEDHMARNGTKQSSDYLEANVAIAYARVGDQPKATQILNRLELRAKTDTEAAFRLAQAHAELGNHDRAIELLRICLEARDDRMVWIKTEPRFESIRNDPGFQRMLKQMRLA